MGTKSKKVARLTSVAAVAASKTLGKVGVEGRVPGTAVAMAAAVVARKADADRLARQAREKKADGEHAMADLRQIAIELDDGALEFNFALDPDDKLALVCRSEQKVTQTHMVPEYQACLLRDWLNRHLQ
jgi:hypothetical protein